MNPNGHDIFITEDDMGEGYDHPYAEGEFEDKLERMRRKEERLKREFALKNVLPKPYKRLHRRKT